MQTVHDLSRQDCARLLNAGIAGRVAMITPTGPHIVPVNYSTHPAGARPLDRGDGSTARWGLGPLAAPARTSVRLSRARMPPGVTLVRLWG